MRMTEAMRAEQNRIAGGQMAQRKDDAVRQLMFGKQHRDFKTTQENTYPLLHFQTEEKKMDALRHVTTALIGRTQQHVDIVGQISALAADYHVELLAQARTGGETGTLQQTAVQYTQILSGLLMSRDAQQRFIFGGQNSNIAPIVGPLESVALPALGEALDTKTYATGNPKKAQGIFEKGEKFALGALATDPGIRDFVHALLIGSQCQAGPADQSPEGQRMKEALALVESSKKQLHGTVRWLGQQQKYLEDLGERVQGRKDQAEMGIGVLQEVDIVALTQETKLLSTLEQLLHHLSQMDDLNEFIRKLNF